MRRSTPEASSNESLVSAAQDGQLTAENLSLEVGDSEFVYTTRDKRRS